ncbi:CoA-binding protein [Streptacidiphilus pinicola]|uniref:CoA-binding protein n=1 Tax=Streptacidiphilus pinicola TaxID=2219663 RepID=A0A2X0IG23_9ACTN|nr:CoA-binding protein [Streptacidiphilus pinicola]
MFRDPASVAVVGASENPAKWGYWLARGALEGRGRRRVHLVNRGGGEVLGVRAVARLGELGEAPELVAVCVPAAQVPGVVDEALAAGARGLLVITADLEDPAALAARVAAAGARLIGPTSLGLVDTATRLQLAWGGFRPGALAVVSQSGQVGTEIAALAERSGLGISRFVSVGAQVDVTAGELLEDLTDHARTRAVALYLEGFRDAARVFAAVRALRAAGKPVLLLTVGDSEAGGRAARSHTGALTPPAEAVDAVCRAAGAVRVRTPNELVALAGYLVATHPPRGPRVAVLSDSGGQGAIAADCLSRLGLHVPSLGPESADALARLLPPGAATANPVDLAGAGERDLTVYRRTATALLRSGEADAVLLTGYFGSYAVDSPALADAERAVAEDLAADAETAGVPLLLHSMAPDGPTADALRDAGVPVFATVETATRALADALRLARSPGRAVPRVPVHPELRSASGYLAARGALAAAGVAFPALREVRDAADLAAAAAALTAPYVLKAAWLEHKTEHGGVRVGLADPAALSAAFAEMRPRLGEGRYVVEEQDVRPDVVELIVGGRHHPELGPLVVVGAGGVHAELHRDTVTECAPVDAEQALAMVRGLRCAPLLAGWRGRAPVDEKALASTVAAVSRLVAGLPRGAELEINPLRVGPDGALAVDALIVTPATHTHEHPTAGGAQ